MEKLFCAFNNKKERRKDLVAEFFSIKNFSNEFPADFFSIVLKREFFTSQ
jgi:hypothetical protein